MAAKMHISLLDFNINGKMGLAGASSFLYQPGTGLARGFQLPWGPVGPVLPSAPLLPPGSWRPISG